MSSPRRAAARLAFAHARNYEYRIIGKSKVYMRQHCQGVHSNISCLNKEKKTRVSGAMDHCNELRHPGHDGNEQQQPRTNFRYVNFDNRWSGSCGSTTTASCSSRLICIKSINFTLLWPARYMKNQKKRGGKRNAKKDQIMHTPRLEPKGKKTKKLSWNKSVNSSRLAAHDQQLFGTTLQATDVRLLLGQHFVFLYVRLRTWH